MNSIEISNLQKNYKNFSLFGMIKPDFGKIKIFNTDITKDTKTKEDIAYVGDESGFLEESKLSSIHKIISKFYPNWDEELYKKYIKKVLM